MQLFSQDNIPLPSKSQGLLKTKMTTTPWNFDHLWQLLLHTAKQRGVGEIVCLLDAVDECGPEWAALSRALQRLYGSKECEAFNLKFLLTSRPYNRIHCRSLIYSRHLMPFTSVESATPCGASSRTRLESLSTRRYRALRRTSDQLPAVCFGTPFSVARK